MTSNLSDGRPPVPPCELLSRIGGFAILAADATGRVVGSAGFDGPVPEIVDHLADLRRMLLTTTAIPATWEVDGTTWRVLGMRWSAATPAVAVIRFVPTNHSPLGALTNRMKMLEERQRQTAHALDRAVAAERIARERLDALARTECDARERADQLDRANRELEGYTAMVAHDLRAPVRTARLLANRVSHGHRSGMPKDDIADLERVLDTSLRDLDEFVLRLLDYSAVNSRELAFESVDVEHLVAVALDGLEAHLAEHEVELEVAVGGRIRCDKELLTLVLREFVVNAVKYRSPQRRPVVSITNDPGSGSLYVADNGVGIDPDLRERAFGMFQRLRADAPRSGHGFGLAYCRRIVERHGGAIGLDDGPGGLGTTVSIHLPREQPGDDPTDDELAVASAICAQLDALTDF